MSYSMLLAPDLPEFRYALYPCSHLIDLSGGPAQAIAIYRDESMATAHGALMWPSTFIVVDLAGDGRS
ncbi:hypothetical protein PS3A_03330 [Pseudomonas sp. 3A(2025)]